MTKRRIIEIPSDGVVCVPIMYGEDTIGEWRVDLSHYPVIDAVEVVHGEWIVCGDGKYVPLMCSACGKTTFWYHAQTANYCPNCGAKMDLE